MRIRSISGAFLAITLGAATAAAASTPASTSLPLLPGFAERAVVNAVSALERGDNEEALDLLEQYLTVAPKDEHHANARFLAAQAALGSSRSGRATALLENLENEIPEVADFVHFMRARAARTAGNWQQALELWTHLLSAWPDSPLVPAARYGLGDAYYALSQFDDAARAYGRALSKHSRSQGAVTARFNLARIAEMDGRWSDAAKAYRTIAYRYPSHPLHADALARQTFLVDAQLSSAPELGEQLAWIDRLLSARSLEETAVALKKIETSIASSADQNRVDYRSAQLAYRLANYTKAESIFKELASSTRSSRRRLDYEKWLARTYDASDRALEAVAVYENIYERYSRTRTGRKALFHAAWLAYNGGEHQRAMALFGRFVEAYSSDSSVPDALWYIAWNAYHLGDLPTAATILARIRREHPRTGLKLRITYWQGRISELMGERHLATNFYNEVMDATPLDYYASLARHRMTELGEIDEAASVAKLVATLDLKVLETTDPAQSNADSHPVLTRRRRRGGNHNLQPSRAELPPHGGLRALRSKRLPWGSSVFDWDSKEGKRAIRLMQLTLVSEAATVIKDMPSLPGHRRDDVDYARARLLYSLGDYNLAYRIVRRSFRKELTGVPTGKKRRYFHMAYPAAFPQVVTHSANEFGVPSELVLALMRQESAYDARARSWASANGLLQIIPRTGRKIAERLGIGGYNYGMLKDPAVNVRFGTWYISELMKRYSGHVALAIASYNAGPIAVGRWVDMRGGVATDEFVEDIPYRETRGYVKRVLGNLAAYRAVYQRTGARVPMTVPATYSNNIEF